MSEKKPLKLESGNLAEFAGSDTLPVSNLPNSFIKCLFSESTEGSVGNTTTESSLIGSGVGNLTLAGNSVRVGQTFRFRAWGVFTTAAGETYPNLTFRLKLGSLVLLEFTTSMTPGEPGDFWKFEADLVIRSVGVSGSAKAHGSLVLIDAFYGLIGELATLNTTQSHDFDLTFTWDTANAANVMNCSIFTLETMN